MVCIPALVQVAPQVPPPESVRSWQPTCGHDAGHEVSGSQVSPLSTAPLPHAGVQSVSLLALQPLGQQPSPFWHTVWVPAGWHWAKQVPG